MNNKHLDLLFITNSPRVAQYVEEAAIDYLFIDLETIGKEERQKNMNTVKSHHTFEDIKSVRPYLHKTKLLVRINPFYEKTKEEIELAIANGADALMLPMFEDSSQVAQFVNFVGGRVETILLLETAKAVANLDDILKIKGIDRIHIGLNDLHLQMHKRFMFELIADGTVDYILNKIKQTDIKYGFGGVSRIGDGALPATNILAYHYFVGSTSVILSRNFCDLQKIDERQSEMILKDGVKELRHYYSLLDENDNEFFKENNKQVRDIVERIVKGIPSV